MPLQGAVREGEVWGLPDTAGFHLLLFYNKELIDSPPLDTEQLVEVAQRFTGDDMWGLGVNSYDPLWVVPWLAAYGGWLTDENGRPTLNTPAMEAALELYQGWQQPPAPIAPLADHTEMAEQFFQGQIPMMIDGDWSLMALKRSGMLNWGVAPLPALKQEQGSQAAAPLVLARYWAANRQTAGDRASATAVFLEYITRPERQLDWTAHFGLLPTRREALDDPTLTTDPLLRVSARRRAA